MRILPSPFAVALVCAPLASVACASTAGHERADSTALHMEELRAAAVSAKEELSASAESLSDVIEKRSEDPSRPYRRYKRHVKAGESAVRRISTHLRAMQAEGAKYFKAWGKEAETIADPDLKALALGRRAKLSHVVEAVATAVEKAQEEIEPFVTGLQDLEIYLENELTPGGLAPLKDKAARMEKDAVSIGRKLDQVLKALDDGAPQFRTARPPPSADR